MGSAYQRIGDYENAEFHLREALVLREAVHGVTDHPAIASTLFRLGELYRATARYEESEALHRLGLAIRRRAFGETHTLVAESMEAMSHLAFEHHREIFEQAKLWGDEAFTMLRVALNEENGPELPVPAALTSRRFTLGCLHTEVAGQADLPVGPRLWQRVFLGRFPRARVARLRALTRQNLQEVDALVLMSVAGTSEETEPLSSEEQDAIVFYVESGGCALLVTDDKDFFRATYGLLERFRIRAEGHCPATAVASSTPAPPTR